MTNSDKIPQSETLRNVMAQFQTWWELVQALSRSASNVSFTKANKSNNENNSIDINAAVQIQSLLDKYGHTMMKGRTCSVCGKSLKFLNASGYCSGECLLKDISSKAMSYLTQPNEKFKPLTDLLDQVISVLDFMNLLVNAITVLPDIMAELATLPPKYVEYVNLKINEGFCLLQVALQKAMIKKNELIQKILDQINFGVMLKPVSMIFAAIDAIEKGIDIAKQSFETGYNAAQKALQSMKVTGLSIPAEGFACACTPRSIISPMPYTSPDASKIFVNLPGGSGAQDLSLVKPLMPSAMVTSDVSQISDIVQKAFPPITTVEYYMSPEAFKVRYALSDQSNVPVLLSQLIQDFLSAGPDYIPKFENLSPVKKHVIFGKDVMLPNVGYVWFLLGLMDGFAPHSSALFGSMLNPAI